MSLVKYCRCDDRLIHGQVIYKWVKHLGVKKIVVVDDETTNDVIAKGLIKMAAPKNIDLSILTVSESRRYFYNNQTDEEEVELNQNINRYKGEFI